jgi:ribulose-5-phosphate 4-epimerase/fuculose-1-phosphate aldolase
LQSEGYVKYQNQHQSGPILDILGLHALDQARTELYDYGFIGNLASGISFGNISMRHPERGLVISGTSTGAARVLGLGGYTWVQSWNSQANVVNSLGPVLPSSEAMSHGAVYDTRVDIQVVIHIHHREFFNVLCAQHYPMTPLACTFGSPELARSITQVVQNIGDNQGIFVTAGHPDGIIAFGPDPVSTTTAIFNLYKEML